MPFSAGEIEEHADACAEEKFGSSDENHHNDLMNNYDINIIERCINPIGPATVYVDDDNTTSTDEVLTYENHKHELKEAITKLNKMVPNERNIYHI